MTVKKKIFAAIGVLAFSTITLALIYRVANPDALWKIVSENCVPTQKSQGRPGKCQFVDLAGRYAVLKDMHGDTRFLLLPTERITGIESQLLLQPGSANYWRAAWEARRYVEERAGRRVPRDMVGLSINSARRRSQNQLHIHIDCVQPDLRAALRQHEAEIPEDWPKQPLLLAGHAYYATRVIGADLGDTDPFQRLAQRFADPGKEMGQQSLSLIGAEFSDGRPGFYLLDSPADEQGATADVVLDRRCKLLR